MTAAPIRVGVQPWFPGPLNRWRWLTDPVPAERMAALRIAVAVAVLLDLFTTTLPYFSTFFMPGGLGGRDVYPARFAPSHGYWSLLLVLPESWGPPALMVAYVLAAVALLVGWRPMVSALVAWACAVSFLNYNVALGNGGDRLKNVLLLTVAVGGTGAVWGVGSVRRGATDRRPVLVPGWPARMLLVQLMVLYFFSGYYKIISPAWRSGYAMYYVTHDLYWSLAPGTSVWMPTWAHQLTSWGTLVWELGFPLLVLLPGTRTATLAVGAFFHVLTLLTLEVGHFATYAVAAYAIFIPWERWRRP